MKNLIIICTLLITTGCINPYTKTLEQIRNQNIDAVFTAYEKAFENVQIDFIENSTKQYQKDKANDLLISGYQLATKQTPDDIKKLALFSMEDIQTLDRIYEERTRNRINEINQSFDKFNAAVNGSKITIEQIEQKVDELRRQRQENIKKAAATSISTIAGTAAVAAIVAP